MKKFILKNLSEILLVFVIPILTLGVNIFESTKHFDRIIGIDLVINAVNKKILGLDLDLDGAHWLFPTDMEFNNTWNMIKNNTSIIIPTTTAPTFIGILGPENLPHVSMPFEGSGSKNLYLIPESVPVIIGFCYVPISGPSNCINNENLFIVGTANDIKVWVQNTRDGVIRNINLFLATFSMIIGVILFYSRIKCNDYSEKSK